MPPVEGKTGFPPEYLADEGRCGACKPPLARLAEALDAEKELSMR
jgi:hypothetical protein